MILLAEKEKEKQKLLQICEKTAFGCKIAGVAASYGFEKSFACFWLDTESDVVFCTVDGLMLISGTVLRGKETAEFLRAVGPQAVMCAVRNAEELGLHASSSGDVLKKQLERGEEKPLAQSNVSIRELYGLLEENSMVEEFEPFYLDLSHKLRHGTAVVFTEYNGSELRGCAVVSSISSRGAVLSALAVREDCRRQGIGSALVHRVEAQFPGKTLYIFRDKEKNKEFYRELGYSKADTWIYSAQE